MTDPRNIWQNLTTKGARMSAAEIRVKARKLEAEIRRDTIIGMVFASAITAGGLIGLAVLRQAEPAARIIIAIVVLLVWLAAWLTTVRNRNRLSEAEFMTCLEFYRRELQRRRDYFAKGPWFLVMIVLLALVQFLAVARASGAGLADLMAFPVALAVLMLVAIPLWKRQARRFQRELDELDKFTPE